jgi:hypothetical protein
MINHAPGTTDAKMVVDALIDGLRLSRPALNDKCSRALRALGGQVIRLLLDVANDHSTRPAHRRRLQATSGTIEDSQPIDDQAGLLIMAALLEALRIDNPQLNGKAVSAISSLPVGVVNCLIAEAACNRKQPGYCVRLLQTAAQFGIAPQVERYFDLFVLTADRHPAIRDAACQLIWRLRQGENYPTNEEPHARARSLSRIA